MGTDLCEQREITAIDGEIRPSSELEVMSAIWQAYEKKGGAPVFTCEMTACVPALHHPARKAIC